MARFLYQNHHRLQSEHLCSAGATDGPVERARRQSEVSRVSGSTVKRVSSFKLRFVSDLSRKSYWIADGDVEQRGIFWRVKVCFERSLRPGNLFLCVAFGAGAALAVEADWDEPAFQIELFRPPVHDLQSDETTTRQQDCRSTSCNLKVWVRSLCCTVLAIGVSLSQPLGAESRLGCNDVAGYYAPARGLEGHELKTKLYDIIKGHDVFTYIQVWDALKVLDEAEDDRSSVIEIYSLKKVTKSLQASTNGWNREHLWPRSYGLVMGRPEFTDLQNLRPSDINVNSSRGNKFFGDCTTSPSKKCFVPANKEAAPDTGTNKDFWMPPAQVRGDIARALMYMAIRYGIDQPAGSHELQLSDSPSIENADMGRLSDLLRWNDIDPPSEVEKLRNNRVCSLYQHNRNPFIDHPEYAKSIWGVTATSNSQTPRIVQGPLDGKMDAWINEFHYDNEGVDQEEFVEVVVRGTVNPRSLTVVLYNGGDGKAYRSLPLGDGTIFSSGEDIGMGFTLFVAKLPSGSIQNGPGDALALVEEDSTTQLVNVLQFISYEGTLKALDGPAEGLQALDIRVKEDSRTPLGSSLGLSGSGRAYDEFHWSELRSGSSPGSWNAAQTLQVGLRELRSKLSKS